MKRVRIIIGLTLVSLGFSCSDNDVPTQQFVESNVQFPTHYLHAYSSIKNSEYLIVFESGLGDDHSPWIQSNVAYFSALNSDVLLYDRAGYGLSLFESSPRNINQLRSELEHVIDQFANGRKVILVGHSLGGPIIRDYAIKNPEKTAALLFVDASHEMYNQLSQEQEDLIYNYHKETFGETFGGTIESRQLIEDMQYMATLPNLPDVPVICLTSMRIDAEHDAADRQLWYNSKQAMSAGVTDFTHITTVNSGHYIMLDEPALVNAQISALLQKLN